MKATVFIVFFVLLPLLLLADFEENYPVELTQPDGKTVNFFASGDEYYGWMFDDKGYSILMDTDGYWVYAEPNGKSIKPSRHKVGEVDPATLSIPPNLKEDPDIVKEKVREALSVRNSSETRNPTTGNFYNLAVLFKCSDQPTYSSSEKTQVFDNFNSVTTGANSVKHFFWEESDEQLNVSTLLAPMGTSTTYGINGTTGYLKPSSANPGGYINWSEALYRIHGIISSMVDYFNAHSSQIPIADFDLDNDGVLDNLNIIIKGNPYLPGTLMWPATYYWNTTYAPFCYLQGKRVDSFNITFQQSSVGTQCHEFSHTLGFPNLHRSDQVYQPVQGWDVMGVGNYYYWNNAAPQSLVYMKYKYGLWFTTLPPLITTEQLYTLDPINSSPFSAYRIQINATQTIWVEYRRERGAFEISLPGSGLIFYRVNTAAGDGNFEGPPDEVYVYRPGGNIALNGNPDLAFFSEEAGRTAFHPYTDPKPFDASGVTVDNIMITEIGSAGESISFRKSNSLSNIWLGITNNWHHPTNWTLGVPVSDMEIQILPVEAGRFYPIVQNSNAVCGTIYLAQGAELTVSTYNLRVYENLRAYGNIQTLNSGSITVDGFVTWGNGSTSSGVIMNIYGNMYIQPGSNLNMTGGTLNFTGTVGAGIYVNETAHIYNVVNNKAPGIFGIASTSTHDLYIDGNFSNQNERTFRNYAPITIHLKGNFANGVNGVFLFDAGTLSFEGTSNSSIQNSSALTCYFNSINIAMLNNSTLSTDSHLKVYGNVTINSGILDCNYKNIFVKGNWNNNAGVNAFLERDGAVIFNGTANQYCSTESFGAIELNKPSGELIMQAGSTVTCAKYLWTAGVYRVSGGSFNVTEKLLNPGIYGTIYLDSGSIDYLQDDITRNDLNGTLNISGGTFTVAGGSTDSYWNYGSPVYLNMSGGVLHFKTQSIIISDQADEVHINLSGGTIRTIKDYLCYRSSTHLNGGTLELYGVGTNSIYLAASSSVYNLNINKGPVRADEIIPETTSEYKSLPGETGNTKNERLDSINALTHLTINGVLTVSQGTFETGAYNITANGGISVFGTLKKTAAGTILSNGDFFWFSGSVSNITAGSISFGAKWRFYDGCNVVLTTCPVTFIGLSGSTIRSSSSTASFGNLTLNGSTINPDHYVYLASDSAQPLSVTGTLTINPGNYLYLNGRTLQVTGNITLVAGSSKLTLEPDAILKIGSGSTLTVNNGATLVTIGSSGHLSKITRLLSTGNYGLSILTGGNISAEYTIFEYMNSSGVNVNSGALVNAAHSFHYCTFQYGQAGTVGTYYRLLTLNNNQTITIYYANFPTNAGTYNKNIAKTINQGTVNLNNYTGSFSGATYEYDTYTKINWLGTVQCDLQAHDISAGDEYFYVGEEIQIDAGVYNGSANPTLLPVRVDLYYNRTTAPTPGLVGDAWGYLNPLAAYDLDFYDFEPTSSVVPGIWNIWMQVDALNEISETNESNNIMHIDDVVTWLALPVVTNTTIVYNSATGQVELAWTYPFFPEIYAHIDAFNIYRSSSPYGPFDYLTGTALPDARAYSEPASGDKYFYQIKAENTWP